jgi:monofunctional biosynthetic peptidoglycan transglycosylase
VVRLGLVALLFGVGLVAWALVRTQAFDVESLARRNPGRTALMRQREREATAQHRPYHESRAWVPYAQVSPQLRRAVLVAEDDAFFSHDGLDWNEIRESARHDLRTGRLARGGSTITQQLAKNLWLGTARTPMRKLEEMFLAVRLERALSKKRIFELYLNVIEWGDGVYGCEAAARRWFGTSAAALDARQSVRLAAVIINPRRYSPIEPPRRIERRIRTIATRLKRRGDLSETDWRIVLGLPPLPDTSWWASAPETTAAPVDQAPPDTATAPPPAEAAPPDSAPPP